MFSRKAKKMTNKLIHAKLLFHLMKNAKLASSCPKLILQKVIISFTLLSMFNKIGYIKWCTMKYEAGCASFFARCNARAFVLVYIYTYY